MTNSGISPSIEPYAAMQPRQVPLKDVEREIARQLRVIQGPTAVPINRARMSNLVIYCGQPEQAESVNQQVAAILSYHPCRVILLVADRANQPGDAPVQAEVNVQASLGEKDQLIFSEQVTLLAKGSDAVKRMPYAVRSCLVGDLPTNLWWADTTPPSLAGPLVYDLAESAQQVIYDSIGWAEPARGLVTTAQWLPKIERTFAEAHARWRSVSDLNWRRLKYWRRLITQALAPASAPGLLDGLRELTITHGPHAVVQACELASWLAYKLGWRVQAGHVQPGIELEWNVIAPKGRPTVRIHRLPEGPPRISEVRLRWQQAGQDRSMRMHYETETRLAAVPEDQSCQRRTITAPVQSLGELVARQLSDRDHDPVFLQSMAVAQVFAQTILARS